MNKKNNVIRHGDVLLVPRSEPIPSEAIEQEKCILALGEVTGHSHQIPMGAKLFAFDTQKYVQIIGDFADLKHEEHKTLRVPYYEYGYDIVIQREYNDESEWQSVKD